VREDRFDEQRVEHAREPEEQPSKGANGWPPRTPTSLTFASPLSVQPDRGSRLAENLPLVIVGCAAMCAIAVITTAAILREEREQHSEPADRARSAGATMRSRAKTEQAVPDAAGRSSAMPRLTAHRTPLAATATHASVASTAGAAVQRVPVPSTAAVDPSQRAERPRAEAQKRRRAVDRIRPRAQPASRTINPWRLPQETASKSRLPVRPTRAQVIAAMRRVTPAVYDCFENGLGFVRTELSVTGKTGRVTQVHVAGGTGREHACIARVLRGARLPKFNQEKLEIAYPFRR
jgi:hypothetical protein